jgi:hypothetical protein
MNFTTPVGIADVPLVLVTVAVKVSKVPYGTGALAESAREIETLAAFTCCETADEVTGMKFALLL